MPFRGGDANINRGGRPKGSTNRPRFDDYFTKEEIQQLVADLKAQSLKHPELLKVMVEQLFGKAPQRLELGGTDGQPIIIQISKAGAERYDIPTSDPRQSDTGQAQVPSN